MTIASQTTAETMLGDGANRKFPFTFRAWEGEVRVVLTAPDYTTEDVTGLASIVHNSAEEGLGGIVTYPAALEGTPVPAGWKLTVLRDMDFLQPVRLVNAARYDPVVIEKVLDRLVATDQQLREKLDRAVTLVEAALDTPQELLEEIFNARETSVNAASSAAVSATDAANSAATAATSATQSAASAEQAKAEADRAAALVDPAALASSVFNVRKAQVLAAGASGQIVTLVGYYYPTRDVLYLSYNGAVLTPNKPGVQPTGDYSYEEVGADPNVVSNQVKLHFATRAGDVLDMFVVSSAAGRNIEEIEALVAQAAASATAAAASVTDAAGEAARAEDEADRAEQAALTLPPLSTAADGDIIQARLVGGTMQNVYAQPASPATKRQDTVLVSSMANGVSFSVPAYIVGSNKLTIYLDGVLCDSGASGLYLEQGTIGNTSTTIKTNDVLLAGRELTAIVAG